MSISKRLKLVASMVTKGNIVADVGTDHGYVPIYLLKENICPRAYAMDINKGPIERAKEHVEQEGLTNQIELIHCDGMKGLAGKNVDTVIIAGMGGELVCRILDESPVIGEIKELVLSPHSEVAKVRSNIINKGFRIVDEAMIEDYGKFYTVIKAHKNMDGDTIEEYSEFDLVYSRLLFEKKDETFGRYLNVMKDKYTGIIQLMKDNKQELSERYFELGKNLEECWIAINKYNEM